MPHIYRFSLLLQLSPKVRTPGASSTSWQPVNPAYSPRAGVEAGGRPLGADGLQTFGGMRALARYVKIEVVPANEGSVVINEASVVFRAWGTVATFVCGLV